jgi:hypothetical protein
MSTVSDRVRTSREIGQERAAVAEAHARRKERLEILHRELGAAQHELARTDAAVELHGLVNPSAIAQAEERLAIVERAIRGTEAALAEEAEVLKRLGTGYARARTSEFKALREQLYSRRPLVQRQMLDAALTLLRAASAEAGIDLRVQHAAAAVDQVNAEEGENTQRFAGTYFQGIQRPGLAFVQDLANGLAQELKVKVDWQTATIIPSNGASAPAERNE